jgi:protein-S-isoprenylcysteine O-methyltransferase Ste14
VGLMAYASAAALVLGVGFLAFRVIVRRDYRQKGRMTPFSIFVAYVAICSYVYFTYVNLPPDWPAVHVSPVLEVIGSVLFYGGLALMPFNMIWLGTQRSHGQKGYQLKQSGFYRWTRNPQALAFVIALVGNLTLWPTWQDLVALILLAVLMHFMVLTEEEHLRRVFGEEYEQYCQRVPRFLGFRLWAR